MICPCCKKTVGPEHFACHSGKEGGKAKSEKKTLAARENAKKGGWPKGRKRKPKV